jgi:hypothetical protein
MSQKPSDLDKKNLKLALILGSIAVLFALGFVARMALFGQ